MIEWKPIETAPKDGIVIIVKSSLGTVHSVKYGVYKGIAGWFDGACNLVAYPKYWTEYN